MASKPIDTEKLTKLLAKYGPLEKAVEVLEEERSTLEAEVQKLKAERKGFEASVAELKQQETELKTEVKSLGEIKDSLHKKNELLESEMKNFKTSVSQLKSDLTVLRQERFALEKEIKEGEEKKDILVAEIKTLEETLGFKKSLDKEIAEHKLILEQLEARVNGEAERLELLDAFLGLVQAKDWQQLESFARDAPKLVEHARQGTYSVDLLRKYIVDQLTGNVAGILCCSNCGAEFAVNKPPDKISGYRCPVCGMSYSVSVKVELVDILKSQLHPPDTKKTDKPRFIIKRIK